MIVGKFITLPIMMLAWIPFRTESLTSAIDMWAKIFNPFVYNSFGMRENTYLIAALVLIGVLSTYWIRTKFVTYFPQKNENLLITGESIVFLIIIPLVIIFLRPINQFIYFQF